MDRTTASYKLREGLAPFLLTSLLEELRECPFSLNIDEATSKTNDKVLAVLVCHFSPALNKVVVNHLDAITLTQVSAVLLLEELDKLFVKHFLPWANLVSVLMDSCNRMRGKKGGLETLIRTEKAPQLLDIDGDSCHHANLAAKAFCKPFSNLPESFMTDLHTEFRWSTDQRDKLFDICIILGIKGSMPERYVPTRWLSILDVALDTLRLMDAFMLYNFSFLSSKDKKLYMDYVQEIFVRRKVSEVGQTNIKQIQVVLQKKVSSAQEGKTS